ncbi:hypothetical protein HDU67_004385 [Dinochytrium kinnereticum]|nr:hypothetical protein HDU67_004385 [Dinochytrium kinnereticum]
MTVKGTAFGSLSHSKNTTSSIKGAIKNMSTNALLYAGSRADLKLACKSNETIVHSVCLDKVLEVERIKEGEKED